MKNIVYPKVAKKKEMDLLQQKRKSQTATGIHDAAMHDPSISYLNFGLCMNFW